MDYACVGRQRRPTARHGLLARVVARPMAGGLVARLDGDYDVMPYFEVECDWSLDPVSPGVRSSLHWT